MENHWIPVFNRQTFLYQPSVGYHFWPNIDIISNKLHWNNQNGTNNWDVETQELILHKSYIDKLIQIYLNIVVL